VASDWWRDLWGVREGVGVSGVGGLKKG